MALGGGCPTVARVVYAESAGVVLTDVEAWHIEDLAPRMREADRLEIWASSHALPHDGLVAAVSRSREKWAVEKNGRCICLFGVVPMNLLTGVGSPWLLGSEDLHVIKIPFLRHSRPIIESMLERYEILSNHVHISNTLSLAWLAWLKFTIAPPRPYGVEGLLFHPVTRKRGE